MCCYLNISVFICSINVCTLVCISNCVDVFEEDVKRLVMLNGSKAIFTIPALLPIIRQMLAADTSLKNKIKVSYLFSQV